MNRKVLLMILDGWGEGRKDASNAIYTQGTPFIDSLRAKYPFSHLQACGEYVGLPDGQMGNSEVGHMNLGAGRVVYQDLVKINIACRKHALLENKEIKAAYEYVKMSGKKLHFMGLTSNGGVHSSLEHLYEFLAEAKRQGLDKVFGMVPDVVEKVKGFFKKDKKVKEIDVTDDFSEITIDDVDV